MPAFSTASPGSNSAMVLIGDPQFPQNCRKTGFPESPVSLKVDSSPSMANASSGTSQLRERCEPDCLRQFRQWHTEIDFGGVITWYRTLPQRQPPVSTDMITSRRIEAQGIARAVVGFANFREQIVLPQTNIRQPGSAWLAEITFTAPVTCRTPFRLQPIQRHQISSIELD